MLCGMHFYIFACQHFIVLPSAHVLAVAMTACFFFFFFFFLFYKKDDFNFPQVNFPILNLHLLLLRFLISTNALCLRVYCPEQYGPGRSKLTTSLVNVSLKFQMLISEICQLAHFHMSACLLSRAIWARSFKTNNAVS